MKYHFLLLLHILAIVGRAAVIPLPDTSTSSSDLQFEAGEFLSEDAYHLENPTTSDDEDHTHQIIIDDNEDNSELQHTHTDGDQDIILDDVSYVLDKDGHTFVVAETPAEGETLHDPGLHITEDQSTPSSSDEDGEDEEYVFEDDEETLNRDLVMDPETNMPLFNNKDNNDFDVLVSQWVTSQEVDSINFYDDDDYQQQEQDAPKPMFLFAFFPSNWRLLMAISGLALVVKLLRIGKNKSISNSSSSSTSPAATHLFSKKQSSKYDHSVIRILPVHGQQARKSSSREYPHPHLVLPPTEDNLAAAAAARTNHRASLGHIRRLSAGNNSNLPMHHSPAMGHHARHTSFSGKYPVI